LLENAPKPWSVERPNGLHVLDRAISDATAQTVWDFFHPVDGTEFGSWFKRFPRFPTAHANGFHCFGGDHAALDAAVSEACAALRARGMLSGAFAPDSFAVMRHKPGWGLGPHYDNACDENEGKVRRGAMRCLAAAR